MKEIPLEGTPEQILSNFQSKSEAIRYFRAQGHERGPIAKALGLRYQHVRNVDTQDPPRTPRLGVENKWKLDSEGNPYKEETDTIPDETPPDPESPEDPQTALQQSNTELQESVMDDYEHGSMDVTENAKTFNGLIRASAWVVAISAAVLLFLAAVGT